MGRVSPFLQILLSVNDSLLLIFRYILKNMKKIVSMGCLVIALSAASLLFVGCEDKYESAGYKVIERARGGFEIRDYEVSFGVCSHECGR